MGVQKKSLSYVVLTVLEKAVDGAVRVNDFVNNPGYYAYHGGWDYPLNKSALSKAIVRLKENGLVITEKVDNGKLVLKLTDKGKIELLLRDDDVKEWDGKWRIMMDPGIWTVTLD
jgi:DNA-binding transcriptional ArsR family regulator